jgi:group I intron endonuclease
MEPNKYLKSRPAVYGIRNLDNGKLYVGKTLCLYRRCSQYKYAFANDKSDHINQYLMAAMKKSGFEKFEMFVLEFCEPDFLQERELWWMQKFNTTCRNLGYNLRMDSSSGMVAHLDTKLKISQNLKRQWAEGKRAGHSEKLKASWANASPLRSVEQSERFRKSRTKFAYTITHPNGDVEHCDYLRLKVLGIKSAVGNMCRTNKNITRCNGYVVQRQPVGEQSCT